MISSTMSRVREAVMFFVLAILSKLVSSTRPCWRLTTTSITTIDPAGEAFAYCLSWRLAVEANNLRNWRTVPTECLPFIEAYMVCGQYNQDLNFLMDQIFVYIDGLTLSYDGLDAWILDVDDTCISNLFYYRGRRFGCDPFDPVGFKSWAMKGNCPAIPAVLRLFNKLLAGGFKVFLVTGRDAVTLGQVTINNLEQQGFVGYERLIMRTASYKGLSAVVYKSEIRKRLVGQGYRIWGNVGDQWSDLQGDFIGNRTFKIPNPMYFVP
ncbi:Acid phosphatase, class B-like [Dillenia turbinata]|uniref:Acid phosphatase, class B-like n=1 Tax=Dillenia turbinata TaxID=194707 RepID=A0AAN8ZQQ7_9MAGN